MNSVEIFVLGCLVVGIFSVAFILAGKGEKKETGTQNTFWFNNVDELFKKS